MRFVVLLLTAFSVLQATAPPPHIEKVVRTRAQKFYELVVAQKYREAEEFVAPDDRETYYRMEKPIIKNFEFRSWALDPAKTVSISVESTTRIRRPMLGEMEIPLSYLSHWKIVDGQWYWYIPVDEVRQTPFGPMHFVKNAAPESAPIDLKSKIAAGPSPVALKSGVKVDSNRVSIGPNPGNAAFVHLENTLPGSVTLMLDARDRTKFSVKLSRDSLAAGEKATLQFARRVPGDFAPETLIILVQPTQQELAIIVQ